VVNPARADGLFGGIHRFATSLALLSHCFLVYWEKKGNEKTKRLKGGKEPQTREEKPIATPSYLLIQY
jgi:hypothetical protein